MSTDANNPMLSRLIGNPNEEFQAMAVKMEDMPNDGIDYSLTYLEPQPGDSYTLKFLKNIEGKTQQDDLKFRALYKDLPDPKRKGKTFHYISSGNSNTCKALELFFEKNELKKGGDLGAEKLIEAYLGRSNNACAVVEILAGPKAEEVGTFRLFTFHNFGENAHIATLVNQKINPSPAQIKSGRKAVDIFDIFETPVLYVECQEVKFGDTKGRSFSQSSWSDEKRGAMVKMPDGSIHEFNKANDIVNGQLTEKALAAFKVLEEELRNPNISVHNFFEHKVPGDPKNTEATEKYVKEVFEKLDIIIPVIREAKNVQDVKNWLSAKLGAETEGSAETIGGESAKDILKNSAPSELANSIMNEGAIKTENAAPQTTSAADILGGGAPSQEATDQSASDDDDLIASTLGGN